MGGILSQMAAVDERDHLLARHCGKSGYARWEKDYASHLRFELPGRNLRLLRDVDQWESANAVFGAGGSTRTADSNRADVQVPAGAGSGGRPAVYVCKPEAREAQDSH